AFCATCQLCQWAKESNHLPSGKLHSLPIPVKLWDSIASYDATHKYSYCNYVRQHFTSYFID
ncbi:hypothetical protein J132_01098, partial [Termitomyces sp. J132]